MAVDYQSALFEFDPQWQKHQAIRRHLRLTRGADGKREVTREALLERLAVLWQGQGRPAPKSRASWSIKQCYREWVEREAEAVLRRQYPDAWRQLQALEACASKPST